MTVTRRMILAAAVAGTIVTVSPAAPADFDKAVGAYTAKHCLRCHGAEKSKGDLRIDTLPRDFTAGGAAMKWAEVVERISSGEMPPRGEAKPTAEESARVVEWLSAEI